PKKNVVVDDIIRVNGARSPDAVQSRKNFRVAFMILAKQGTTVSTTEINRVESLRTAWEAYFRDESAGGKMFTALGPVDMDADGYNDTVDCNDDDPLTHPGATEVCNGIDDNCDGQIDETFDKDGDLYTYGPPGCLADCNDDPNVIAGSNPPTTGFYVNPG